MTIELFCVGLLVVGFFSIVHSLRIRGWLGFVLWVLVGMAVMWYVLQLIPHLVRI